MQIVTNGLVIREVKTGEADRIITILSDKYGLISASAKNSMKIKSNLLSATSLFSYSEFTLYKGKSMYIVNDAHVSNVFHNITDDLNKLALAMYLAEFTSIILEQDQESKEQLNLLLNCLYVLNTNKYPANMVKAVYELRTLSNYGFMPNLVACSKCFKYEGGAFAFRLKDASLLCSKCAGYYNIKPNISSACLKAMRHIIFTDNKKIFSFKISDENLLYLSKITEAYLIIQLDRSFKTLDFLKSIS